MEDNTAFKLAKEIKNFIPKKWPLFALAAAGAFAGAFAGFVYLAPLLGAPPCCDINNSVICNIGEPTPLTAVVSGGNLDVSWNSPTTGALTDLKYYLVSSYANGDLTTPLVSNLKVPPSAIDPVSVSIPGAAADVEYLTTIATVCDNCQTSGNAGVITTCAIVLEDILMMDRGCLTNSCVCSDETIIAGSVIPLAGTPELFKVTVSCPPRISWFTIHTEFDTGLGKWLVNIPEYSDIRDNIVNPGTCICTDYDAPERTMTCGVLINTDPPYQLDFDFSGPAQIQISAGPTCSIEIKKCNDLCDVPGS